MNIIIKNYWNQKKIILVIINLICGALLIDNKCCCYPVLNFFCEILSYKNTPNTVASLTPCWEI